MRVSRWVLLGLSVGMGALMALSCSSTSDEGSYGPFSPASSAERALAKAERAARKKVLDEQKNKDAGPTVEAPPEPVPEPIPEPIPEPVVTVPEVDDAGPPVASASVALDAGPAPDTSALCEKICERTVACAKEKMAGMPGPGQAILQEALKSVKADCLAECAEKAASADKTKIKKAEACLNSKDCTAFIKCVEDLEDDDASAKPKQDLDDD